LFSFTIQIGAIPLILNQIRNLSDSIMAHKFNNN